MHRCLKYRSGPGYRGDGVLPFCTALLVVHAAALNPVSKGCHFVAKDD
jgi:hypothetical protein